MKACKTCKYWKQIETANLPEDFSGNALTHAAREAIASDRIRGLCQKIPVAASDSTISEIDFTVQNYDDDFEPDSFEVVEKAEVPKAYVSEFYGDPYDLSSSFITGEDFGCVNHQLESNLKIEDRPIERLNAIFESLKKEQEPYKKRGKFQSSAFHLIIEAILEESSKNEAIEIAKIAADAALKK